MKIQLRNKQTGEIIRESEGDDATHATLRAWQGGAAQRNRREGVTHYEARIAPEPDERHKIADGERVAKTREELVADGVITQEEADEQRRSEIAGKLAAIDNRLHMHRATREWYIAHPEDIHPDALAEVQAAEDEAEALRKELTNG